MKIRIPLFFLFSFVLPSIPLIAQTEERDSLIALVKILGQDSNKAISLNLLSRQCYYLGEYESAMDYAGQANFLSEKIKFPKGQATALKNIGNVFNDQANFSKALDYYLQALKINEQIGDKLEIAKCNNNIGGIYKSQNQYEKALQYQFKTLKTMDELHDSVNLARSCNNIGDIFSDLDKGEEAIKYYNRALIINQKIGSENGIGLSYLNMGQYYDRKKSYDKSLPYFFSALEIRRNIQDIAGMISCYAFISEVYSNVDNYKLAISYADSCLVLSKEIGDVEYEGQCYALLSQNYGNLKNYEKAYRYQKLYKVYADSIFNIANSQQLSDLKTTFEVNKKAEEITAKANAEKEKVAAITKEEKKRQQVIVLFVVIGLLMVVTFSIVLFNRLRITRKQKSVIEEQKQQVEKQKHIIEEKQKEVIDSINYAKRIQAAILAKEEDITQVFQHSFLLYMPKDIVAGDFYFFETTKTHVFYAAADCTGHGVPGALVSVVCSNALTRCVNEFALTDPGKILDKTRELVLETFRKSGQDVKDGMDISFISIDKKDGRVKWAGANNPLWFIRNNELNEIKANKQPIGSTENPLPFTTHTIDETQNTTLFLFTDGYADQFGGPKGKKYKYKQLEEKLISINEQSFDQQKGILRAEFEAWRGELEQVDDVCVIGIRL